MLEKNSLELYFVDPAVLCFVPSVKITINQYYDLHCKEESLSWL